MTKTRRMKILDVGNGGDEEDNKEDDNASTVMQSRVTEWTVTEAMLKDIVFMRYSRIRYDEFLRSLH